MNPVLVVGAGLSAADAVTICRSSGIKVIHVYRNRSAGLDKMLPETVYPEYHEVRICNGHPVRRRNRRTLIKSFCIFFFFFRNQVHKMMKDGVNTYDLYSPMPEHTIVEFHSDAQNSLMPCNQVVLKQLNTGELTTVNVSFCAILIGFRPDLYFLDSNAKLSDDNKYIQFDSACDHEEIKSNGYQLSRQCQLLTVPAYNLLNRKIAWLKNLCAKCRHLSLCERSRRNDLNRRSRCVCLNNARNKLTQPPTINHPNRPNDNNNNYQIVHSENSQKAMTKHILIGIETTTTETTDKQNNESDALAIVSLGEDSSKPIDCKTNPIAVDKFTNEIQRVNVKGLYAMGPLVGDNFIRFIPGGALAITAALNKVKR